MRWKVQILIHNPKERNETVNVFPVATKSWLHGIELSLSNHKIHRCSSIVCTKLSSTTLLESF